MYIDMYIYLYVYVCFDTYVFDAYTLENVFIYTYTYAYIHMDLTITTGAFQWMHRFLRDDTHVCIYAHSLTCVHTCVYTHTYIHALQSYDF